MSTTIEIAPSILSWALNEAEYNSASESVINKLNNWKNGENKPTFAQLKEVSKKLHIPFGYFLLDVPPVENIPLLEFRTVNNSSFERPTRELIDTIHAMENIIDWTKSYLIEEGLSPNKYVGLLKNENDVQKIADQVRNVLGIKKTWYEDVKSVNEAFRLLRERISEAGIIVMMNGTVGSDGHRKLEIEEFRAFAIPDSYAPLIFVNRSDSNNGILFSLIHELTHILLGKKNLYNAQFYDTKLNGQDEKICNAVAAEILVPRKEFIDKWKTVSVNQLPLNTIVDKVASYFKCGTVVIARRALDFRFINQNDYLKISDLAKQKYLDREKNKAKGGNYYKTLKTRLDRRFVSMLFSSVEEGKTPYTEAYRLTGTNRNSFTNLVKEMGIYE